MSSYINIRRHTDQDAHTHIIGHSHLQLFYSIRVIFNNKLYYTENFLSFQPNIRSFTIACVCARFLVVYIWNLYWLLLFGDNYYSYHTCVISIETECVSKGDSKRQCEWKLLTKRYTINDQPNNINQTLFESSHQKDVDAAHQLPSPSPFTQIIVVQMDWRSSSSIAYLYANNRKKKILFVWKWMAENKIDKRLIGAKCSLW